MNISKKFIIIIAVLCVSSILVAAFGVNYFVTRGVSGADWQAGNIISDSEFYNNTSMSTADIQNFLNSKVPVCDTNGTQRNRSNPSLTNAQYAAQIGLPGPPYICLKDYYQVPRSDTNINNFSGSIPSGAISAAEIIKRASDAYKINPRVLLTKIQKESQGPLIMDSWPVLYQYRSALGYACPDTAPCDPQYEGFYNQVTNAAKSLNAYKTYYWTYRYKPFQTNTVYWNPNYDCGSGQVDIQGYATASLYNYTPYQPNQAALNNMYGTGDSCSSYGNRNFWRIYSDWFGNTNSQSEQYDELRKTSIVEYSGSVYTFYYDGVQKVLRMDKETNGQMNQSVILDGNGGTNGRLLSDLGNSVTATVYNNSIQVFYYDEKTGNLRHAWSPDGANWNFENLDGSGNTSVSGYISYVGLNPTALSYNGSLQLFYYDKSAGNLRHAWANDSGWHFENLDGDTGSTAKKDADVGQMSAAAELNGSLQLFYYDKSAGNLRHAWANDSGWHFENLDGDTGSTAKKDADVGQMSAAAELNGSLQLFYYDKSAGNLRHAWANDSGWHFENLEGDRGAISGYDSNVGITPSVTVYGNSLQLLHYDRGNGVLRHAWANDSGWHFENLEGGSRQSVSGFPGLVGANASLLSVKSNGTLRATYLDYTNGYLRKATSGETGWKFSASPDKIIP
jgi:hypothetical protein